MLPSRGGTPGQPEDGIMRGAPSQTLRHAREHIWKRPAPAISPEWASSPDMDTQHRHRCRGRRGIFPGGEDHQLGHDFSAAQCITILATYRGFLRPADCSWPSKAMACHRWNRGGLGSDQLLQLAQPLAHSGDCRVQRDGSADRGWAVHALLRRR